MILTSDCQISINYADLPFVIENEEAYEKALAITERLFFNPNKSLLEDQMLRVWTVLVENYETTHIPLGESSTPTSILTSLMEAREMTQSELVKQGVGSSGVVSEIVNGKRNISKDQAKKLAEIFHVDFSLFL